MKFGFIAKPVPSSLAPKSAMISYGNQSFSNLEEILSGAPDRMKLGTVM
jgi:hypothetical protein